MRPQPRAIAIAVAVALVTGACFGGGGSSAPRSSAGFSSVKIPQPSVSRLKKLTRRRLAPDSQRVDLGLPTFSNPTAVTNPLFPISDIHSSILRGRVEGDPLKVEITLLPETKTVTWNGIRIRALQSQFLAFLNGRINEVAIDLYAQADDGSVWYLGEDVFDYKGGDVVDVTESWRAGVDGPPALIMPAHPRVGDVYRTENIPGVVFEEVTVKAVDQTVTGPSGPVHGAMVGQELHMEGDLEDKVFAPGYGEFHSGGGPDVEANALTVPADRLQDPTPAELKSLYSGALDISDAARSRDWSAASRALHKLTALWDAFQVADVPRLLDTEMHDALAALTRAVTARDHRETPSAALAVAQASLDLELRYRPPLEVDLARFALWTRQLETDARTGRRDAVVGDVATLEWIRDRFPPQGPEARSIDDQLRFLEGAAQAGELTVAADAAARLRGSLSQAKAER